jgi:hypothetical protein
MAAELKPNEWRLFEQDRKRTLNLQRCYLWHIPCTQCLTVSS